MADETIYLTAGDVQGRYKITSMTLHRWLRNEKLQFPQPMVINRRRLFKEADILEWERRQAAVRSEAA